MNIGKNFTRFFGLEDVDTMAAGNLTPEQKEQLKRKLSANHETNTENNDRRGVLSNDMLSGKGALLNDQPNAKMLVSRGTPEKQTVSENKDETGASNMYSPSLEDLTQGFGKISLSNNGVSHGTSLQPSSCGAWTEPSEAFNGQTQTTTTTTASVQSNNTLQNTHRDETDQSFNNPQMNLTAEIFRNHQREADIHLSELQSQNKRLEAENIENMNTIENLRKKLEESITSQQTQHGVVESLEQENSALKQENTLLEQNNSLLEKEKSVVEQKNTQLEREKTALIAKSLELEEEEKTLIDENSKLEEEKKSLNGKNTNMTKENETLQESFESMNQKLAQKCTELEQKQTKLLKSETLIQSLKAQLEEASTMKQEYCAVAEKAGCEPVLAEIEKKLDTMKNDAQKAVDLKSLNNKQGAFIENIDKVFKLYGCSVYSRDSLGKEEFRNVDDVMQIIMNQCFNKKLGEFRLYGVPVGAFILCQDFDSNKTEQQLFSSNTVIGFRTKHDEKEIQCLRKDNELLKKKLSKESDAFKMLENLKETCDKIFHASITVQNTTSSYSENLTNHFKSCENIAKEKDLEIENLKSTQKACIEDLKLNSESLQTEINCLCSEKKALEKQAFEQKNLLEAKLVDMKNLQHEIKNLKHDFSNVKGSTDDALTKLDFKDTSKYSSLGMNDVDKISLVDAQNFLKKALYIMDIPFYKFELGIVLYSLISRLERRMFYEFIDVLYVYTFDESVDMKLYTQSMYEQYQDTQEIEKVIPPIQQVLKNLSDGLDAKFPSPMSKQNETKTCYYELLGVESTASSIEIKKAYRKQALIYHPDKNPDNIEEATLRFSEISIAYETLSDPQERSWYDSHKNEVLYGGSGETGDADDGTYEYYDSNDPIVTGITCDEIMKFFMPSLYTRLDDSPAGLYQIAGKVFSRIAKDEVLFARRLGLETKIKFEDDFYEQDIRQDGYVETCKKYRNCGGKSGTNLLWPSFGYSETSYEELKKFYKRWSSFNTVKNFAWKDEYRIFRNYDRRTKRELNKRNERIRNQFKNEYNKTVKNYVNLVKKYDIRMKLGAKREEEAKRRQRLKEFEALKQKSRSQHSASEDVHYEEQDWQAVDESKYEELEKTLADFDDLGNASCDETLRKVPTEEHPSASSQKDYHNEDKEDVVYVYECFVCNKTFKSDKQLNNHNNSKMHKQKLKQLQREMKQQDMELGLDQVSDFEEFESANEDKSEEAEEEFKGNENTDLPDEMETAQDLDALQAELDRLDAELEALESDEDSEEDAETRSKFNSDEEHAADKCDFEPEFEIDIDIDESDHSSAVSEPQRTDFKNIDLDMNVDSCQEEHSSSREDNTKDNQENTQETLDVDDLAKLLSSLNDKKKSKKVGLYESDDDWIASASTNNRKGKGKKKKAKQTLVSNASTEDTAVANTSTTQQPEVFETVLSPDTICGKCGAVCQTRNQLFKHVKSTGHISSPKEVETQLKKLKKLQRKGRKRT
ncbi:hypothetical protein ACO0QE_000943 [Hanseniaspora vineae]